MSLRHVAVPPARPPCAAAGLHTWRLLPAGAQCISDLCDHPAASVGLSLARGSVSCVSKAAVSAPGARRSESAPSRGLRRLPHLPLLCLPLLQLESAPASRLDCCVKIRRNEAPRSRGLAPGSSTVSQLQFCSVYVGQKNKKKRGWIHILFLFHVLCFRHWSCGSRGPS